jgi:hypothetical protein
MYRLSKKIRTRVPNRLAVTAALILGMTAFAGLPFNKHQELQTSGYPESPAAQSTQADNAAKFQPVIKKPRPKINILLFRHG